MSPVLRHPAGAHRRRGRVVTTGGGGRGACGPISRRWRSWRVCWAPGWRCCRWSPDRRLIRPQAVDRPGQPGRHGCLPPIVATPAIGVVSGLSRSVVGPPRPNIPSAKGHLSDGIPERSQKADAHRSLSGLYPG